MKSGFFQLAKKSLAVITASLNSLFVNNASANPVTPNMNNNDNGNFNFSVKKILRPKLVLKLNPRDPENSLASMHSSHSSHSSHMSSSSGSGHSSHSSHSSHYSSSPSYTPSYTPSPSPSYSPSPTYTPPPKVSVTPTTPSYPATNTKPIKKTAAPSSSSNAGLPYHNLGSRILYKGCKGTDVKELQELLIALHYFVTAKGTFDSNTEFAVKDFQNRNNLPVDGRVGAGTLALLQSQ